MGIVLNAVQPGHELLFSRQTVFFGGRTKVVIASEIDFFAFWKGDIFQIGLRKKFVDIISLYKTRQ